MMVFPDPVAFSIGSLKVYWYGLAYAMGGWLGWHLTHRAIAHRRLPWLRPDVWARSLPAIMAGIVIGGRLGFVLLYEPMYFWQHPWEVLAIWNRGMSFHGGLLGVIVSMGLLARRCHSPVWPLIDGVALSCPLGIMLGRIANFINQEHIGRPTSGPFKVLYPLCPDTWRHPAPLYEALLEGALLGLVLWYLLGRGWGHRPKALSGGFCIGYGVARWVCEYYREPDGMMGGLTTGQWYTIPCVLAGLWLWYQSYRGPNSCVSQPQA